MAPQLTRSVFQAATALLSLRQHVRYSAAARFVSHQECDQPKVPRCGSEHLSKTPCAQAKKAQEKSEKSEKAKPSSKSMWENPECCLDPCKDMLPRFDELYYRPSDKLKRVYQQTWVECPERKIVKKFVCEFEKLDLPPLKKRARKDRPETACSGDGADCDLMKCLKKSGNIKCPKLTLAGCRQARNPPKCKRARYKLDCKKVCCPYPSFSECKRPRPKPRHPIECNCLKAVSLCDIHDLINKMHKS